MKTLNKKKVAFAALIACVFAFACMATTVSLSPRETYADTPSVTSVTQQTGLGLGINVVTAQNFNDFKLGYMVFDNDEIQSFSTSTVALGVSNSVSESTIDEDSLLASYSFDLEAGGQTGTLLTKLKLGLKAGFTGNFSAYCYKYYSTLVHNVERYRLRINNYALKSTYADSFSSSFLSDLDRLANDTLSYETFFNRYGTHIVGSAIYGGKLIASYSVLSSTAMIDADVKTALDGVVSFANIQNATVDSVCSAMSQSLSVAVSASTVKTAFSVATEGGSVVSGLQSSFQSSYTNWCNSFSDNSNCVVIGFSSDGLVPLWEILPDSYASVAEEMRSEFFDYYDENEALFRSEFGQKTNPNFQSGAGTATNPFVIANATQLRAIETTSMRAYYKLGNNIDLSSVSQWTPLGGFYKEYVFTGSLDGNSKTISNLTRTDYIYTNSANRSYFGLFGYIGSGGVVKNMTFSSVNINMAGPEVTENEIRHFLGVVAGTLSGSVFGVTIASGTVKNDRQTTGMGFVGGIAGAAIDATISSCTNNVDLFSGRFSGIVGGMAGYTERSTFKNCKNNGTLTAKGTAWGGNAIVGGIAGFMYKETSTFDDDCSSVNSLITETYNWGGIGMTRKSSLTAVSTDERYS